MKMSRLIYRAVFMMLIFKNAAAQTVTRGPYLQMVNQTEATIRWRTDVATSSKVNYGTTSGVLTSFVTDATAVTEHEMRITGLTADTKYFYNIGSIASVLDAAANNWLITAPLPATNRKIRIAAFGDCGIASTNQNNVRDKYLNYIGSTPTDVWLLLGDNAYSFGYDNEYQAGFFDGYKNNMLRNHPLFPAPGNHDYRNDQAYAADRTTVDYYKIFTLPKNAECGGVASNTEAYYSFNWGNVHFLSLDSYGKEDANTTRLYDTLGAQVTWIKQDLAANTKKWVIAYWHHPPFTLSTHNSDTENELIQIRQNFIRILERYGVDLVLCGHSHGYERSYLLKGYYTNQASFVKATHTADSSSAKYDASVNSCPYHYDDGKYQHGTVYVVSGSAGQSSTLTTGMKALPFVYGNGSNGGSSFIEVDNNRLDLKMIGYDGLIKDQFTIMKDVNKVTDITISNGNSTTLTASWPGNFVWNTGPVTQAVSVSPVVSTSYTVRDNFTCLKDSFRVTVAAILPLRLISFTGNIIENKPVLNWVTAQEMNVQSFNIQRMLNGVFATIGTVPSRGNSSIGFSYSFKDADAPAGTHLYRLQTTDLNGAVQFSEVVQLKTENKAWCSIFPTALDRGKAITIQATTQGPCTIDIANAAGKIVWHSGFTNATNIPTAFLNSGVYLVIVKNKTSRITQKVWVQ